MKTRVSMKSKCLVPLVLLLTHGLTAIAQQNPTAIEAFVSVNAPVFALTHARVIDGTGAPAREDQTIVIRDGTIAAIGDAARTPAPEGATAIDLSGKSIIPGLVMMHEHLGVGFDPAKLVASVSGQVGIW
jgi:adenine deaminase